MSIVHGHLPKHLNQIPHLGGTYKLHSKHGLEVLKQATCHHEVGVAEEMNKSLQMKILE